MCRGGNEGPGEHRAVNKQEKGPPPDTRETGGLPPPNIPYFEGLSEPSKEEKEARSRDYEYSGTLVQPPEPPEMRAASKAAPLGGPPPGALQPCRCEWLSAIHFCWSVKACWCSRLSRWRCAPPPMSRQQFSPRKHPHIAHATTSFWLMLKSVGSFLAWVLVTESLPACQGRRGRTQRARCPSSRALRSRTRAT